VGLFEASLEELHRAFLEQQTSFDASMGDLESEIHSVVARSLNLSGHLESEKLVSESLAQEREMLADKVIRLKK
jgi:hypothetical protein